MSLFDESKSWMQLFDINLGKIQTDCINMLRQLGLSNWFNISRFFNVKNVFHSDSKL